MRFCLLALCVLVCACTSTSSRSKASGGSAGAGNTAGQGGSSGAGATPGTGGVVASGGAGGATCAPCSPTTDPVVPRIDAADMVLWTDADRLVLTGRALPSATAGLITLCTPNNLNCSGTDITHSVPLGAALVFGNDLFVAANKRVVRVAVNTTVVAEQFPANISLTFPISALTVDESHVFVTPGLGVTRIDRSGGAQRQLNHTYQIRQLRSGDKRVFYTSETAFGSFIKPESGGSGLVQMDDLFDISSDALVVVSDNEVYFATAGAGSDIFASDGTLGATGKLTEKDVSFAP
ncbi:MAG TPA: hypothetical protein PKD61_38850, partial [Polyangiaceae bacterium]|nr:hypothetical protein [Polyangiaceae bacterium]